MTKGILLKFGVIVILVFAGSCEYNQLSEPEQPEFCDMVDATYNGELKSIIDNSCAYSGCHDGAGGIGTFDFTNYEGLSNAFNTMRSRVLEFKDDPVQGMPPNSSVYPQSQKDDLTQDELELFECWIDAGFPED